MWLIKSEPPLFKSIKRYLIHNINVPENQIVKNYKDQCRKILVEYNGNTREFFQFLNKLPNVFDIHKFIIFGEKIVIKKYLSLFLKDNNGIEIRNYLDLLNNQDILGGENDG